MKKVLFLLGLFTLCATVTFAQDRSKAKARTAKPSGWYHDDSLLWVKKPVDKNATIKSPRDAASGQKGGQPKQDKLGNFEIQDVKAPNQSEDKLGDYEIQRKSNKVVSPRDPASGQATGRRMQKPRRPSGGN